MLNYAGNAGGDRVARSSWKTAEGRFTLVSERVAGLQPFNYQRSSRLTLATLHGGPEDGVWIVFNVGDCVHICRYDATHKEPTRSLIFNSSPVRTGYPTCHAFQAAKDGVDFLVGLGDGSVMLMSLRAQLGASGYPAKPVPVATVAPEGVSEAARCTAVAWVPRSEVGLFVAAYSTGSIYVYKKSHLTGEGGGKFSLSLGSSSKAQQPSSTITLVGGGVNDVAASPDGRLLAAACRDGALRLLDLTTGAVLGGCMSYYGAALCCAFSPDGKYVAVGCEDDLVAVYGVAERAAVLHGEGHRSWVSRVAWDPWTGSEPGAGSRPGLSDLAPASRIYRLGSAGQDCQLCLWDVQAPGDGDVAALVASMGGLGFKRNGSVGTLAGGGGGGSGGLGAGSSHHHHHHDRKGSLGGKGGGGSGSGVCASLPRCEMAIAQPVMEHKVHLEPMSDLLFAEDALFTVDHTGNVRMWRRPQPGQGQAQAAKPGGD